MRRLLQDSQTIEILKLSETMIDEVTMNHLSKGLKTNASLKELYLSKNNLASIESLKEALLENSSLAKLNLTSNKIDKLSAMNEILE